MDYLNPYLRAAYIGEVGGMEMVVGGWYLTTGPTLSTAMNGGTGPTPADTLLADTTTSAVQYGLDLQLQGDVGDVSVGFYLPYTISGEFVNPGAAPIAKQSGGQAMLRVGFGHMGINLGYDYTKYSATGAGVGVDVTETRPYLGGWYSVAQNVELILAYTNTSIDTPGTPDVSQTTFVVEYVY
jgi:hypothetical protein